MTILSDSSQRLANELGPLSVPEGQRAAIFGMTGTGKSTLARHLLSKHSRVLMIDPKTDFDPPTQFLLAKSVKGAYDAKRVKKLLEDGYHVIYRPHPEHSDQDDYDQVLKDVFWIGDCTVYIDELTLLCRAPNSYPRYLRACYQQGRSRGIGTIGVSQRPAEIPGFCNSEREQIYSFSLVLEQDQERVGQWMGVRGLTNPPVEHGFWYRSIWDDQPRLCVLNIRQV